MLSSWPLRRSPSKGLLGGKFDEYFNEDEREFRLKERSKTKRNKITPLHIFFW